FSNVVCSSNKQRAARVRTVCTVAIVGILATATAVAAPPSTYDDLIERARAGDYEPALQMLRQQGPAAVDSVAYDHSIIAGWAGKPSEVVAAFERSTSTQAVPEDVLLTVARSYRDLKNWPEA